MVHHTIWIIYRRRIRNIRISKALFQSQVKCNAADYTWVETWTILKMPRWRSLKLLKCGYGETILYKISRSNCKQTWRCCNWCKRRVQWSTHQRGDKLTELATHYVENRSWRQCLKEEFKGRNDLEDQDIQCRSGWWIKETGKEYKEIKE